jgi:hypothetical protein
VTVLQLLKLLRRGFWRCALVVQGLVQYR